MFSSCQYRYSRSESDWPALRYVPLNRRLSTQVSCSYRFGPKAVSCKYHVSESCHNVHLQHLLAYKWPGPLQQQDSIGRKIVGGIDFARRCLMRACPVPSSESARAMQAVDFRCETRQQAVRHLVPQLML